MGAFQIGIWRPLCVVCFSQVRIIFACRQSDFRGRSTLESIFELTLRTHVKMLVLDDTREWVTCRSYELYRCVNIAYLFPSCCWCSCCCFFFLFFFFFLFLFCFIVVVVVVVLVVFFRLLLLFLLLFVFVVVCFC